MPTSALTTAPFSPLPDAIPTAALRRALIIKLRHHGDVLLASPVPSVLKRYAPDCDIDALVFADTAAMLSEHPAVDQLHTIDRQWKKLGPLGQARAEWRLFQTLRSRRYDLVIHLTDHPRGAWLARFLGARWSVAPQRTKGAKWWKKSFTHLFKTVGGGRRHTVEMHLDALRRLGIQPSPDERALTLVAGDAAETRVGQLLASAGAADGYVHFHPASRWFFKTWPVAQNAEVLRALVTGGRSVVVTAAPDAREQALVTDILTQAGVPVVNLCGQLSLKELAAVSRRAALFIGVDSAPMHIAAAVGTPTVALFGPSGDKEWGPWMVPHELVMSTAHPCRPCGLDGCGGGKVSDCLVTLPAERVLAAAQRLLGGSA
ncbi:MAG: putative lipopolysaccharide heptosyltransferase III [Rhodocyclaceae bacterium]